VAYLDEIQPPIGKSYEDLIYPSFSLQRLLIDEGIELDELGNLFFHEVESLLERQYDRMLGDDGFKSSAIWMPNSTGLKIEDYTTDAGR
jgi:hypothetical protein